MTFWSPVIRDTVYTVQPGCSVLLVPDRASQEGRYLDHAQSDSELKLKRGIWISWKYVSRGAQSTAQAISWHLEPGFSLVEFGLWSYQPAMWTEIICCQSLQCLSPIFAGVYQYSDMGRSNEWPQWWGLCRTGSSACQIQLLSQCKLPMACVLVYANLHCSNF